MTSSLTRGRTVRYFPSSHESRSQTEEGYAAIVTDVHGEALVNLFVFFPTGEGEPRTSIPHRKSEETRHSGTWDWPMLADIAAETFAREAPDAAGDADVPDVVSGAREPKVGETVIYMLSAENVADIMRRREDTRVNLQMMRDERPGFQAHVGNAVAAGDIVAMTITQVWANHHHGVNGQVTLDGNDSLWVRSADRGWGMGLWRWSEDLPPQPPEPKP